jgi:N-acetylglucosamine kinase-like BadF-type ATPase
VTYFLGVDGGNTKTVALVARPDGTVIGAGRAGFGDIYRSHDPGLALSNIAAAIDAALSTAGITRADLVSGGFSLAGADWPEDYELLQTNLNAAGYGRTITVVNDALGALRAGSPDGTGVVVVCGTGVATGARGTNGQSWHASFWQDANGASEMGPRALWAICRAELGIDPPTDMKARALALFNEPSVESLLHHLTSRQSAEEASRIGLLAPVLLDAADDDDETASTIVCDLGNRLGDYAVVAARKVGIIDTPFHLVLAGGVFRHHSRNLQDCVISRVHTHSPDARPQESTLEPVIGAVLLAFDEIDHPVDDSVLDNLRRTAPPPAFFATAKDTGERIPVRRDYP